MDLKEFTTAELKLAGLMDKDSDYGGMLGKAVLELIDVFENQHHSGMSASMVIDIFSQLALFKPINPITGEDHEWNDISLWGGEDGLKQNMRESGLFKDKNNKVTYNSAIIKRTPNGTTWSGPIYMTKEDAINDTNRFHSSLEIKGFPFTPKTFYIDVLEEEIKKDDWIMWVKDPKQLDEVWEYYKKPEFLTK